ncbi:MAG: hypothetical protein ACI4Q4_09785 [Oscillospiraceae bacterium]
MRFLYVFALMFLATFGLAMLVRCFADALLRSAVKRFDVTVLEDDGIDEFVGYALHSPYIARINIIETPSGGGRAAVLAKKYDNVHVVTNREQRG